MPMKRMPAQRVGGFDRSACIGYSKDQIDLMEKGWNLALSRAYVIELEDIGLTPEEHGQMVHEAEEETCCTRGCNNPASTYQDGSVASGLCDDCEVAADL